jgi:hypothetical protein
MNRTTWKHFSTLAAVCAVMMLARSASAASIAWVSFHATDAASAAAAAAGHVDAPDKPYTDLLTAAGHTVTRYLTTDNAPPAGVTGHDVIIISRSVNSGHYQSDAETAAWNGITKPIINMAGYTMRGNRLGYVSASTNPIDTVGDVRLNAANPAHPLFTGIVFDGSGTTVLPYAGIVTFTTPDPDVVQRGISVPPDSPVPGAQILATIATAADPTFGEMAIGYYPAGTTMVNDGADDVLAGRRLVFLSGSREAASVSSETAGMYDLTPTGAHLFLNAVTFLSNVPEPSSAGLATFALAGLAGLRRKARMA